MKKIIRNNIIGFIIGFLLCFSISVGATSLLSGDSVEYKNDKNVSISLNEIYSKASQLPRKYKIGDKIKVKNEDYYVISDSPREQDYVTLLKAEPLTVDEVNIYGGVGTENNHVNKFTNQSVGTSSNWNGYGTMAYYTSETCGYVNDSLITTDCTTDYDHSDIKYVIDAWANATFTDELKLENEYKSRLITKDEIVNVCGSLFCYNSTNKWIYNGKYRQWTMSSGGKPNIVFYINDNGIIYNNQSIYNYIFLVVRPVINIYKNKIN